MSMVIFQFANCKLHYQRVHDESWRQLGTLLQSVEICRGVALLREVPISTSTVTTSMAVKVHGSQLWSEPPIEILQLWSYGSFPGNVMGIPWGYDGISYYLIAYGLSGNLLEFANWNITIKSRGPNRHLIYRWAIFQSFTSLLEDRIFKNMVYGDFRLQTNCGALELKCEESRNMAVSVVPVVS